MRVGESPQIRRQWMEQCWERSHTSRIDVAEHWVVRDKGAGCRRGVLEKQIRGDQEIGLAGHQAGYRQTFVSYVVLHEVDWLSGVVQPPWGAGTNQACVVEPAQTAEFCPK